MIPVDGHLIDNDNTTVVDESALTGEPIPKTKKVGDPLFSGTVNVGDAFEMITDKLTEESQYSKIVKMVKSTGRKSSDSTLLDSMQYGLQPFHRFYDLFGWIITGKIETILSVLVVASPCSLIFATPIAIIGAIKRLQKLE